MTGWLGFAEIALGLGVFALTFEYAAENEVVQSPRLADRQLLLSQLVAACGLFAAVSLIVHGSSGLGLRWR